jgi:hypothetical protein
MSSSSSKVQVAAVNIANMALLQPGAGGAAAALVGAAGRDLPGLLVGLLDHSLLLLRTKALLAVVLLARWGQEGGGSGLVWSGVDGRR